MNRFAIAGLGLLLILVLILFNSCRREEFNFAPIQNLEVRTGNLQSVEGAAIGYSELSIVSFIGSSNLDERGNFSLKAPEADKFQQLFVISKKTENVIYIGLYNPKTKKVVVNDTSTVLSLLLINPHLLNTTQEQRQRYIESVKKNSRFPQILSLFKQSLQTNPEQVFDFETNPLLYQTAVQIMKETVESLQQISSKSENGLMIFNGDPSIEDVVGKDIVIVNPRHVFYGAGIYPTNSPLKEVITINRQSSIVSFNWDLNNLVGFNVPAKTNYALGDGQFRIYLAKGPDFSKILEWNDPVGRATICNTGQTILSIFDLVVGYLPNPKVINLPKYFFIKPTSVYQLGKDIKTKNIIGFVSHLTSTIVDNAEGIALWVWQGAIDDAGREVARKSTEKIMGILGNVSIAFKLLSFANGPGPMFYDLIFAPDELNFYITQKDGVITSTSQNLQPAAKFKITPPSGIIGTKFVFDASESTDDLDNISQLEFRWDFDSDGTWDTDWSSSYTSNHSYSVSSSYVVTLAVQDKDGLIGTINHSVNVGGGAGSASHIKLFMDSNPWTSDAMIRMLKGHGFTEGTGNNTYEVINSSNMGSLPLTPGKDLIIISNDQPQSFYDHYAANQVRFTNFVYNGGSLFWEACDEGWNNGSMKTAGVILPGNISSTFKFDNFNYLPDPSLPLVAGLPAKMDHNYASHEHFTDLPDGTTIYCTDSNGSPTLIEFNFGNGWIIITGQPLEHQFDRIYGAPDMEKLLPAIVSYFTGKQSKGLVAPLSEKGPLKPSYLH